MDQGAGEAGFRRMQPGHLSPDQRRNQYQKQKQEDTVFHGWLFQKQKVMS